MTRWSKSSLCLFNLTSKLLNSTDILSEILTLLFLVQLNEMLHDTLVKVLSSQVSITVGGNNLKDTIVNGQQGNIEGASSQIKDQNVLLTILLVHTVSNSGGGWLVDDSHNVETGNDTSILPPPKSKTRTF